MRTDSDPDLVEIDSRGLPADALEWADTAVSEVVHQPVERNCATVGVWSHVRYRPPDGSRWTRPSTTSLSRWRRGRKRDGLPQPRTGSTGYSNGAAGDFTIW